MAFAIGMNRMENRIDTAESPTMEATEPGDWLSAHGDYLFNLAVGQVRDPLVAEDLVQETFLAALKARERFSGRSSDRTWLVGICGTRSMTTCAGSVGNVLRARSPR